MLVTAHAPPSFRGSSYLNNENLSSNGNAQIPITYCRKWQTSRSLTTSLGTAKTVPYTNVTDPNSVTHPYITSRKLDQINNHKENCHGHLPGCPEEFFRSRDLKTLIDLNLNQALPSGMEDVSALKQDQACYDVCNNFAGGASCQNIASNGHSKFITPNIEKKGVKELDLSACNLQEATSALQFTCHKIQGDRDSEKNGKRIIGFPIDGVNKQSSMLVSTAYMEKLLADKTKFTENDNWKFTNFSCGTKILNLQKKIQNDDSATEIGGEMNSEKFRPHINLNAEFACADDSIPSEPISEGELVVQSSHSISIFGAKDVSGTDIQTSTCQVETNIMNQDKHISSDKKDDSEKQNFCDQLARFAAENLVAISVDSNGCHNNIGCNLLCLPQFDTLRWFAKVVSHSSENLMQVDNGKNQYARSMDDDNNWHGDHDDNAGGGLDLFEAITLELEEVKVDQQCCRAKENDAKDDKENGEEVKGPDSMLFTKPRCGQGKKRRQRRDFQKDVLPGLASLSRLQVSEDLQSFWGMMKPSRRPWQVSSTKRNTDQNSQRKGRRQQRSMVITVEEVQVIHHQPSPLGNAEIGVDGSSMVGWGRTTRRCRRRRCLPGNLVGSLR
ncbi:uncharacterized protein LOC122012661 [Zingiber officinale]|nr:uncharacterized protein LOC122012661 [Zingiber officinale]XP_042425201.1 uncharacterized protein LOC122012661 [Zingiber officinale]XP_042425202.1 uncharacterized protein LOC122012661 [Zingiber officinale]